MVEVNRRIAGLASVVTMLVLVARFGLNWIAEWGKNGEFPAWAPTFGTFGETVALYSIGTEIVEPLVLLLLAVGFGQLVGRRINVAHEYRRIVDAVTIGSTIVVAAWTLLTWYTGSPITDGFDIVLVLASFASTFVSTTLPITIGALAGAALAYFRRVSVPPTQSTVTNHESSAADNHDL